jgi:hypothetical protein
MNVYESQMDGQPFVDAVEPKNAWGFQIAARVEVSMLINRATSHVSTGNSAEVLPIGYLANYGFNNEPLPYQVWRCVAIGGIILQALRDECPYRHRRQKSDPTHALADRGHQLDGKLVRNLVQPQRIQGAFARTRWIVRRQEWKGRRHCKSL